MATYRATITVEIVRSGGAKSIVSETVERSGGDNPRFARQEVIDTVATADALVRNRFSGTD